MTEPKSSFLTLPNGMAVFAPNHPNPAALSQIMEIRALPEWQEAVR